MMPMNRIIAKFKELKKTGRKALIGYLTAGDPNLLASERNIRCALENGLDILELGVPFSDPIADGIEIQTASQRALSAGIKLDDVFTLVEKLRKDYDHPIILFGYMNPFFTYSYEQACKNAAAAGVDGMLIVDLPFEESVEFHSEMKRTGLILIPLVAPTTPLSRINMILKNAEGFIYYIMVKGVTGAREHIAPDLEKNIRELGKCTDLPIAVGFGISSGLQARIAAQWADGVVVGSALIKATQEKRLVSFIHELSKAMCT